MLHSKYSPLNLRRFLIVVPFFFSLSACGIVHDRSNEYLQAASLPPVKVPANANDDQIKPLHPIPKVNRERVLNKQYQLPKPPDITSDILDKNYVIEQLDGQTWLLVNEEPGRIWPATIAFLKDHGLDLAQQEPRSGLMQSVPTNDHLKASRWLTLKGDGQAAASSDQAIGKKVRVVQAKLAPGLRRRTTEVQFRVRDLDAAPDSLLAWPKGSEHAALERQMLSQFSDYLKTQENTKSYSRLALQISSTPKVKLISQEHGQPHLLLNMGYDRAWSEVGRALGDAHVDIVDINRSQGLWYVDFRTKDEKSGGWFSWFRSKPKSEYTFLVHLARDDKNDLIVTAQRAPDYDGTDRSARLLSTIYEHMY
ncbi:outer membrane protein assembly factor BamC [Mangrovitalea sediminis]|uniref:outer membrane protein assembly factor BamC n=1 Tax=Mangrovitalea sediminis TaxID=1982043 RepID=UPI000BE58248|nr:outer membrane protein assembly factor BamC [Mangrovitalea sediminis]